MSAAEEQQEESFATEELLVNQPKRSKSVSFSPSSSANELPKYDVNMSCGSIGSITKERPAWVKDEDQPACYRCNKSFSLIQRRHHCRGCGNIFCANCSDKTVELIHLGYTGLQRVCGDCFTKFTPRKAKKKRNRAVTQSPPVLQASMTLNDSLGRPIQRFHFSLTKNSFRWYKHKEEAESAFHVMLSDILTVKHPTESEFMIHAYPWRGSGATLKRHRLVIRVRCDSQEQREEWTNAILERLDNELQSSAEKRKFLILVNPFGGTKRGHTIWKEAEKLLRLVDNLELSIRYTEYQGHAGVMVSKIQVAGFSGIVCVSGDGLIHEVFNGLMRREDWEDAIKLPVGTIPAGSGNAFAAELGIMDPTAAAFAIAKGKTRPLDLLQVSQEGQPDLYSFLSINWGMISDVDFESEKYRFVGGARFTVGALVRITNLRYYHGTLEYVEAASTGNHQFCTRNSSCPKCKTFTEYQKEEMGIQELPEEGEEIWQTLKGKFVTIVACNISKLSYDTVAAPYAHLSDNCIDLLVIQKCARGDLLSLFGEMETGAFINNATFNTGKFVKYLKVKKFKLTSQSNATSFGFDGERGNSFKPLSAINRHGIATVLG